MQLANRVILSGDRESRAAVEWRRSSLRRTRSSDSPHRFAKACHRLA
jgi:hypothetical protein